MAAWCPQDYSCTFTQIHPRVIVHSIGPWWHTSAGFWCAGLAIIAIAAVLMYAVYLISERAKDKRDREEAKLVRQQKMDLAEQRTMQLDAAKGNPDMLKVVQNWDYGRDYR